VDPQVFDLHAGSQFRESVVISRGNRNEPPLNDLMACIRRKVHWTRRVADHEERFRPLDGRAFEELAVKLGHIGGICPDWDAVGGEGIFKHGWAQADRLAFEPLHDKLELLEVVAADKRAAPKVGRIDPPG
jgi:hypothetical protein